MKSITKDKFIALIFMTLTIVFLLVSMTNQSFFNWVFDRHHNQWSWYLRPFFLIPFCYFAYAKSWTGISISIFCLFTSMFWFSRPELVADNVKTFLQFEKEWLYGDWNYQKIFLMTTVPFSFFALGLAFWKRSLILGLGVMALMATGKIIWSIQNAGEAGKSIIIPAVLGLILCSGLMFLGFKNLKKKKTTNP